MRLPCDPTTSFVATYDAWNRLVGITSGGTTVAGYEYDGAKRRIIKKSYSSGTLTETRHAYFTEPSKWQVIEERVDSSSNAERQFVWGLRYIDDIVLRDRDTDGNGTLDERLYGMQDANWNVTGLVSTSGTVQERYAYSAYGKPMFLDASFGSRSVSSFDWERLFAGYVWDANVHWYAVRHRVYVVGLGWVQRDPVYVGTSSENAYAYVHPVMETDPSGARRYTFHAGPVTVTVNYGPWRCRKEFIDSCKTKCAKLGAKFLGCVWVADIHNDVRDFWNNRMGTYFAFVHCCCKRTPRTPEENDDARSQWDRCRKSFREKIAKTWGEYPVTDMYEPWPVHHVDPLEWWGDPIDPRNLIPVPPDIHNNIHEAYRSCYGGIGGWDQPGPYWPY